jgi:hypothetical protein
MSDKGAQVRALLDTADSYEAEGNEQAAESYRAKAQQLMVKYRIDQEEAIAVDPAAAKPIQRDIVLAGYGSKYRQSYHTMWYWIMLHCEVESWAEYKYSDAGYQLVAHVVGYAEDIEYAEMLFTSARLTFTDRLEPKLDPNASDQVNAYRLRASGMERIRVAEKMWGNTDKVFLARVGRLYKAECEARGEEPLLSGRGVTGKAYREQYAEQFVVTLSGRLWQARQAASASGGGLVLHGRKERIKEAFYAFYPERKPAPALPSQDEPEPCAKCAASKRGACKGHYVPMGRSSNGPDYHSVAAERGRMAGHAAAREVGIQRGGGRQELS